MPQSTIRFIYAYIAQHSVFLYMLHITLHSLFTIINLPGKMAIERALVHPFCFLGGNIEEMLDSALCKLTMIVCIAKAAC